MEHKGREVQSQDIPIKLLGIVQRSPSPLYCLLGLTERDRVTLTRVRDESRPWREPRPARPMLTAHSWSLRIELADLGHVPPAELTAQGPVSLRGWGPARTDAFGRVWETVAFPMAHRRDTEWSLTGEAHDPTVIHFELFPGELFDIAGDPSAPTGAHDVVISWLTRSPPPGQ